MRVPNLEAQRAAMKKLAVLVGRWAGEARIRRGSGAPMELDQTEEAVYKLDGSLLLIEGVGRRKTDSRPALEALAVISYDDETKTYRMRAFNDGRFLETEMKLLGDGCGLAWGFSVGEVSTHSVLRINDDGEWIEVHEITIGTEPRRPFMEVSVSRQQ